jgi:maltose O-acetyltransferase
MTAGQRRWMKLRGLLVPDGPHGDRTRGLLYEPFLASHGANFKVATAAFIFNPNGLRVGDNVYVGFGSYIGQGEVTLGDEVLVGNHVTIVGSNHLRKAGSYRFGGFKGEHVTIGRGTWLAAHCVVTAGVTVGAGCVVAAGAVVTKDFGDGLTIAGVPARVIGEVHDDVA